MDLTTFGIILAVVVSAHKKIIRIARASNLIIQPTTCGTPVLAAAIVKLLLSILIITAK